MGEARPILPGATLGILGGGQLGRMVALAARPMGYAVHVLDPDAACACEPVVERCVTAPFDDVAAAEDLARGVRVMTLEIEKIGLAALRAVERVVPLRPGAHVLEIVQDRARQKAWLARHGFPLGAYRGASSVEDLERAITELGGRCFVKAATGGYDGRGQVEVDDPARAARAWAELRATSCVVEKALELDKEISVMVARRPSGESAVFPVALNHHEQRILAWSVSPAPIAPRLAEQACALARDIAVAIELVGVLAVEMFVLGDGSLLVNELAPRPHNSFHATEMGCATSQFEQLVRAVCDLPLGSTEVVRPAAIMNLLGDLWLGPQPPDIPGVLAMPSVRLHLYGKSEARPGRKMGHLSAAADSPEAAVQRVEQAYARLRGEG